MQLLQNKLKAPSGSNLIYSVIPQLSTGNGLYVAFTVCPTDRASPWDCLHRLRLTHPCQKLTPHITNCARARGGLSKWLVLALSYHLANDCMHIRIASPLSLSPNEPPGSRNLDRGWRWHVLDVHAHLAGRFTNREIHDSCYVVIHGYNPRCPMIWRDLAHCAH